MVVLVTSIAALAMVLDDHSHHIAEMEGMAKTIRELKDNITRFCHTSHWRDKKHGHGQEREAFAHQIG